MYINTQFLENNYNKTPTAYVEVIRTNVSNDGTFKNLNDLFNKLSLKLKTKSDKEIIFDIFKDCIYFGSKENKKLNDYIKSISVKEEDNIFNYYD